MGVRSRRCRHGGCIKHPSYGKVGGQAEFCAQHAENGMVDVRNTRCRQRGCSNRPSFGKVGGTRALCAQHATEGMIDLKQQKKRTNSSGAAERAIIGLGRAGSTTKGGSTDRRVEVGQKRKGGLPPSTRAGASSGSIGETSKRARAGVDVAVVPSPPRAAAAAAAAGGGRGTRAHREPAVAADRSSSSLGALVKTEAHVGIPCKAEPSEAQGM